MKGSDWVNAVVDCLRDGQSWHKTFREDFRLLTAPSSSLGIALAIAVLGMGYRVSRTASEMSFLRTYENIHGLTRHNFVTNTNA